MTAPKFSFNIGATPTPTTASTGIFGSLTSTPQQTNQNSSIFGSLSTPQQTQPSSTGFGFGSNAKPATANVGFGTNTGVATTTSSPFSFGQQKTTTSAFAGFGSPLTTAAAVTTAPLTSTQSFSSTFGQQQQSSIFSLNKTLQTQPQQQNQTLNTSIQSEPPKNLIDIDYLSNALININIFNDERDSILAKWNQLQAFYGIGKVFYQNSTLDVTKDNRLSRFKTISYNCKPSYKNENGFVTLIINQKEESIRNNQKTFIESLHKVFNSEQSLEIKIDSIKSCDDNSKTELIFYVEQRVSPMNDQRNRVPSMLVFNFLNKQEAVTSSSSFLGGLKNTSTVKQQLEQLNIVNFYPLIGLNEEQIKKYLDSPPIGFNPNLWEQAKKQNPNPKKLLPVQLIGFQEINKRFKLQNKENQSQKITLNTMNDKIDSLNKRNELIKVKIEQFKLRNEDLEQRILKVLINYEIRRKIGIPLQENERYLLSVLESFQLELNSPINKEVQRQKLNEFLETIKSLENSQQIQSKKFQESVLNEASYLSDVQKSLRDQQKAFKSLIEIINTDLKDLNLIKQDLYHEK